MSRLTIDFNLLQLIMFWLMSCWIFKMSSRGSNADMETSLPVINVIINNSVRLQLTHQPDTTSNHWRPALFSGRLVTSDFIIKYIEVRAVRWPEIWKIIRSHRLLHFWTGGSEWCTECQGRHSSGKGNDQQNLSKMIMGYRSVYNQNASDDWRYNIDVYKLMMHIMHLVLVNMIII